MEFAGPPESTAAIEDEVAAAETAEDTSSSRKKGKKQKDEWHAWPLELTAPAPPRTPPALTADRFASAPCFGDVPEDTRPHANLYFKNGYATQLQSAAHSSHSKSMLSPRLSLPPIIYFYVHVKFHKTPFPFPPGVDTKKYLLEARTVPGHEELGVQAHVPFDEAHVIGLQKFHLQSFAQLVVVVPSTDTINPRLQPAKLSFHPRHSTNLHRGMEGGSERSEGLPRLILNVWPKKISHGAARGRHSAAALRTAARVPSLWGTFGSSDGRMGPVHRPMMSGKMSVCPEGKVFTRSAAITGATQAAAARFGHDRKLPSKPLGDAEGSSSVSTAEEMNEAQPQALDSSSRANTAKQRWVMRPSFLMA